MTSDSPISWTLRNRLSQMVLEQRAGEYRAHHAVEPVTVTGPLDLSALGRAWLRVQQRHPELLCGFDISRPPEFIWHLSDPADAGELVTLTPGSDDAVTTAVLKAVEAPFDLARGPLTRLVVAPTAGRGHVLALAVDHAVADFWSLDILMHDLTAFYAEETGVPVPPRPPISLTYPEFARRENAYLESPAGIRAIEAVGAGLVGTGAIPEMRIAGFTGAPVAGYMNTGVVNGRVDVELLASVRAAARRARVSLWTFLHAALHKAIADLSDGPVAATTLQTANRERSDVQQTVGWLAGKVVVSSRPEDTPDTAAFLRSFSSAVMDALDGAVIPWPRVVAEFAPEAFGRHAPVPYISFNSTSLSMRRRLGGWAFPGCRIGPYEWTGSSPDAAIIMGLTESETGIAISMYHRTDWYPADAAWNLWQTVEQCLRAWVKESGVR